MNTGKQVNVMVGLLMVFAVGTLLYFLWDSVRAEDAEERQLIANMERGGKLYAINCRFCHGLRGLGPLEAAGLPGLPLDTEANRPTDPGQLAAKQQRFRDTIRCGRVGTLMPPWSQDQGGPLNDFQIEQLILLMTSDFSVFGSASTPEEQDEIVRQVEEAAQKAWEHAVEEANHADDLGKQLAEAVSESDQVLTLNDARGLKPDNTLRIDDDPLDEVYEIVTIVDAPAATRLLEDADAQTTELKVEGTKGFQQGDIVQADDERMRVTSASGDLLRVERGVEGTEVREHAAEIAVFEAGNEIRVERGAAGTQAAPHEAGTEVLNGPIPPPTGPRTGEQGTPPCGQLSAAPAASPTPTGSPTPQPSPTPVTGAIDMQMGDNFFELAGQRNPTLTLKVGETITVNLTNSGAAIHNMRTAGEDNTYNSNDDDVSDPALMPGGSTGTLEFRFEEAGTFDYRCDFHPDVMKGQIVVTP